MAKKEIIGLKPADPSAWTGWEKIIRSGDSDTFMMKRSNEIPFAEKGFTRQIQIDSKLQTGLVFLRTWKWHEDDDGFAGMLFREWTEEVPLDNIMTFLGYEAIFEE